MHLPTLSQKVNEVIQSINPNLCELRRIDNFVHDVLKHIENVKSLQAVMAADKDQFTACLKVYIQKKLLIRKCMIGRVQSQLVREIALNVLYYKLIEKTIYTGINKAAKKLEESGVSKHEAITAMVGVIEQSQRIIEERLKDEIKRYGCIGPTMMNYLMEPAVEKYN